MIARLVARWREARAAARWDFRPPRRGPWSEW